MPSRFQSRGWRRCRSCFRGFRVLVLLLLLFAIGAGYYLNQIGLPDFLKRPLVRTLQARGIDLKFTRLRWRYTRGLVAENVRFGQADAPGNGPGFSAQEVELKLNHAALRHFNFTVDSVILHGGTLTWPVNETNEPPRKLSIDAIQTQFRFLTNDLWELDRFAATFAGAALEVSGAVTNASALSDWKMFQPSAPATAQPSRLRDRLRELADTLDRIKFHDQPELKLFLLGDGRDPQSFAGRLTVRTSGAETPWGSLTNGYLIARLIPPKTANSRPHGNFELVAASASTRWGSTEKFKLLLDAAVDPVRTNLINCQLVLQADRFNTAWARSANAWLTAEWVHSLTNAIPLDGHVEMRLADPFTAWGQAGELMLEARLGAPPGGRPRQADASWAWWADLEPYFLDWNCRLRDVRAREFQVKEIGFGGTWRAPLLAVTNLHSELYQGQLDLQAELDVATRIATFTGRSDFDAHSITPLLTPMSSNWLNQFSWEKPPAAAGRGRVVLPAWTNRQPDWHGEVLPTFAVEADITSGPAAYKDVWTLAARLHLNYSNNVTRIPDLVADGTNGRLHLLIIDDDRTHDYYFRVHSDTDIRPLRKLLEDEPARRAFDSLVMTEPPVIDAEIWGRWHHLESIGIKAQIALANFTLRGESATNLHTGLFYTNHFLLFDHPRVERGDPYATADSVGVNIDTRQLFLTNAFSTLDPMAILHTIGPKVTKTMEPYQFGQPPTVRANGIIPLEDDVAANVRFNIEGGPFQWNRFKLARISGAAEWVGDHLALTGVQSEFYGGRLNGSAAFDFPKGDASPFSFDATVADANLSWIMAGLFTPSNHLEGAFNGRLTVTRANTDDWKSWFGQGTVDLHDGLIWDIPIFGIFSKVLDAFVPGSGESRASEGAATFVITNSVIYTSDLKIRAPAVNMLYRGTSDFDGRVDAIVEAQVLKNTPFIGPLLGTVLGPFAKIFEYKVTGTLGDPKPELRWWAARIFTKPFEMIMHPFNSLKEVFPANAPATNAPPVVNPPPEPAP